MKYYYQSEKLNKARSTLMLPHPRGEAASIAQAFFECSLGLNDFDEQGLDEPAREWVLKLKAYMDTTEYEDREDPMGHGLYYLKASDFTEEQRFEISHIIDELAHWFDWDRA